MAGFMLILKAFLTVTLPPGHCRVYADSHFFSHGDCDQGMTWYILIVIAFLKVTLLSGYDRVSADSHFFSHFFSQSYSALRA